MLIEVPKVLRDKLGDDGCTALVEVMNRVTEKSKEDVIELCVQRFERRLAEESVKTRAAVDSLRVDTNVEMAKLRVDIAGLEVRILRWMVTLIILHGVFTALLKYL